MSENLDLDRLIADHSVGVVVCCGSGGVGKTTTAAALGLRAAEAGRRVVVLTIDPARRLAQSLGLVELDNTPRPVAGIDASSGGRLDAMMTTWTPDSEISKINAAAGTGKAVGVAGGRPPCFIQASS